MADMEIDDDEEAMQAAMLLSMGGNSSTVTSTALPPSEAPVTTTSNITPTPAAAASEAFMDADFVNQLLGSVEVDLNDPFIVAAREQLDAAKSEQKNDDKETKK